MSLYEYLCSFYFRVKGDGLGGWEYRTSPDGDWHPVPNDRINAYYKECT